MRYWMLKIHFLPTQEESSGTDQDLHRPGNEDAEQQRAGRPHHQHQQGQQQLHREEDADD